jgi:CubicO group peptidase (beta-lactamase class C family)
MMRDLAAGAKCGVVRRSFLWAMAECLQLGRQKADTADIADNPSQTVVGPLVGRPGISIRERALLRVYRHPVGTNSLTRCIKVCGRGHRSERDAHIHGCCCSAGWSTFPLGQYFRSRRRRPSGLCRTSLGWIQNRDHDPAIATLIEIDGRVAAQAVVGSRALGHPELVTVDDRWHIGSCTKAFTATLIGTLVDGKVLSWDEPLESLLPALAKNMDPAYRRIALRQLLSHTAGLPPLTNTVTDFPTALTVVKSVRGASAQRMALARYYLSRPPASAAGAFQYSNLGYVIAGAIAEAHTGKTWETLIHERVFDPLGIREVGFGPPGHSGKYDQPLGHGEISGREPLDPADPGNDGPTWLAPAGVISIGLKAWAVFAQDQLDGALGHGKLLTPATYKALQSPATDNYAMGWGSWLDPDGTPKYLTHEGSNGFWVAAICIYPKQQTIILMATNFGGDVAKKSIGDLGAGLADHLKLFH